MFSYNLLSIIIFLPLIGVITLTMLKAGKSSYNNVRAVGLLTSISTLILSILLAVTFDNNIASYQFVSKIIWLESLEIDYHIGIDGMSLPFIILTTFITPLAMLFSCKFIKYKLREHVIALLVLETMILGMFSSIDLVLFYLFFEGTLIPMIFLIGIWGGEKRIYASVKFFLYTFFGSILMLIAIITICIKAESSDLSKIGYYHFGMETQIWLWWAFFIAFAIKIPMLPLHTWLPDAHVEAPTSGSVILASILLKMGGYGLLRVSLPLFPEASQYFANIVFSLSIIAIIYASLLALAQKDIKKLIAYSSIAHMGIVTFGIFTFSKVGIQAAIFQMISHGIISAGLFFCIGILYERTKTKEIALYGGLVKVMPHYAVMFMIFILATIGLPGTSGFIGEFLVIVAAFKISGFWSFGLSLSIILSAIYALYLYKKIIWGNLTMSSLYDIVKTEKIILIPLVVFTIVLGLYPDIILKITENPAKKIVKIYDQIK